ncbi:MAG TPA: DUF3467 domain-containing protein [Dissulfurispiraceae bacterium]|nr:DUF3467 domain-containing protein [Dissulfurispiraceae bacterium]
MAKKMRQTIDVNAELAKAEEKQQGPDIYSNNMQVYLTANEMVLDFFYITPMPGKHDTLKMQHMQRVLLPSSLAKGTASALVNVIKQFEQDTGVQIFDTRGKHDTDLVDLWTGSSEATRAAEPQEAEEA